MFLTRRQMDEERILQVVCCKTSKNRCFYTKNRLKINKLKSLLAICRNIMYYVNQLINYDNNVKFGRGGKICLGIV